MEEIDAGTDALHDRNLIKAKPIPPIHNTDNTKLITQGDTSKKITLGDIDKKITLGTMLTILDGIKPLTGSIIIMTTNHIEILDPALLRDGRVDAIIELGKMNLSNLKKIITKYYPNVDHLDYNPYNMQFTPATITSLLRSSHTYPDFINKLNIRLHEINNTTTTDNVIASSDESINNNIISDLLITSYTS
jgi:SpoVK/Ycf46/Vps4 family AAA+-type ATPase